MSAKATNALAFYTIAQMEQHVSLIKEEPLVKLWQFIVPMKPIYNKNFGFNKTKKYILNPKRG